MPKTLFERMSEVQRGARPITDRMGEAKAKMLASKRYPKAYYLTPTDFAEFTATVPRTVEALWGNNPPRKRREPAFDLVPVRESKQQTNSRLYNTRGSAIAVPD